MTNTPPTRSGAPILGCALELADDVYGFGRTLYEEQGGIAYANLPTGRMLIITTPEPVRDILIRNREAYEKPDDFAAAFGNSVISVSGDEWERQRELLNEFFYPDRIRSFADTMVEAAEDAIEDWSDGEVVPMIHETREIAAQVIFEALFNREVDFDGDDADLLRASNDLNAWFRPLTYTVPNWVPTPGRIRYWMASRRLDREADRLLQEADPDDDDLLSTMKRASRETDAMMDRQTLRDQLRTFIFGGTDTSVLAITYTLHLLGRHPDVRNELLEEIDDVVGDDRPTLEDLDELDLLEQVLNETLRLYPPAYNAVRKTAEDVEIGGYHVPEGEDVTISIVSIHRNPDQWEDPLEWRPERWTDMTPHDAGDRYLPFSLGPRTCIGRRLARLEIRLVLARILQEWVTEPMSDLEITPKGTSQPADDVPMRLERR